MGSAQGKKKKCQEELAAEKELERLGGALQNLHRWLTEAPIDVFYYDNTPCTTARISIRVTAIVRPDLASEPLVTSNGYYCTDRQGELDWRQPVMIWEDQLEHWTWERFRETPLDVSFPSMTVDELPQLLEIHQRNQFVEAMHWRSHDLPRASRRVPTALLRGEQGRFRVRRVKFFRCESTLLSEDPYQQLSTLTGVLLECSTLSDPRSLLMFQWILLRSPHPWRRLPADLKRLVSARLGASVRSVSSPNDEVSDADMPPWVYFFIDLREHSYTFAVCPKFPKAAY